MIDELNNVLDDGIDNAEEEEFDWDRIYKIKIGPNEIEAKLNGNNYLVDGEVDDSIVAEGDYIPRLFIDGEEMKDMKCTNKFKDRGDDKTTHLIFHPVTAQEKEKETLKAQIEYISMMNDIDW